MGTVEESIVKAQAGDRIALEEVIRQIQPRVYALALRMLWHPEDARDATQEILLRVVTHLGSFRGESRVLTWVYRIAENHLLNWRKSRMEERRFTFESFGKDLEEGLVDRSSSPDDAVLLQEIRVGCTLGMLVCLDRAHRAAYVLGEILDIDSRRSSGDSQRKSRCLSQTPGACPSTDRWIYEGALRPCKFRERLPMSQETSSRSRTEASRSRTFVFRGGSEERERLP